MLIPLIVQGGKEDRMKCLKRRVRISIICFLISGCFLTGIIIWNKLGKIKTDSLSATDLITNNLSDLSLKKMSGYQTIVLAGVDSRSGDFNGTNSDTMMIANIDHDNKKIKLVSLYRDTYLNIEVGKYGRANSAYLLGGAKQMLNMMNQNLDLNLSEYIITDFKAVTEVIDLIGGIDIKMDHQELDLMNGYCVETSKVTGKRYTPLKPNDSNVYHLNGVQAVSYARIRYTAGNDFRRTARQRYVMEEVFKKAKKEGITTLNSIADTVFPMISTNISEIEILKLGLSLLSYEIEDETGFPFTHLEGEQVKNTLGLDCVVPVTLEENVIELHQFLYKDVNYTPSETVKEYSKQISDRSLLGISDIPEYSESGSLPMKKQ